MENKYQEAIDFLTSGRFRICDIREIHKSFLMEQAKKFSESKDLLQELVDKETPMKPNVEIWELSSTDENDVLCPRCNELLCTEKYYEEFEPPYYYCWGCGQKLDWSE